MLFPSQKEEVIEEPICSNHFFESISREMREMYPIIKKKNLCPMLEKYRGYFSDESMFFQGTKTKIPGEQVFNEDLSADVELKTSDRVLDNLDRSILENKEFDQASLVEELENASVMIDEEEIDQPLEDYQVEDYSAKQKLQQELLDSQANSQSVGGISSLTGTPLISAQYNAVQGSLDNNFFLEDFQYWACLEPEKWKFKTKRIKTSRKKLRGRKTKQFKEEKYRKDFDLVFGPAEENLKSKEVIQIMKKSTTKNVDIYTLEFEDMDPVIPLNTNVDSLRLLCSRNYCFSKTNSDILISKFKNNSKGSFEEHNTEEHVEVDMDMDQALSADMGDFAETSQHVQIFKELAENQRINQTEGDSINLIKIPNENTLDISKVTLIIV